MLPKNDDNETRPPLLVEKEMIGFAGLIALFLVIVAAGYMIIYPNHVESGYSSLYWNQTPIFSVQNEKPTITFSVELESHERKDSTYTVRAYVEEKVVTTKLVDLSANKKEEITFVVSVPDSMPGQQKIKVTAQQVNDMNTEKASPVLEITDWVTVNP